MAEVILIKKEDVLILHAKYRMRHEDMEREAKWFRDKMGIEVRIIDGVYDIAGVEEHGKGIR